MPSAADGAGRDVSHRCTASSSTRSMPMPTTAYLGRTPGRADSTDRTSTAPTVTAPATDWCRAQRDAQGGCEQDLRLGVAGCRWGCTCRRIAGSTYAQTACLPGPAVAGSCDHLPQKIMTTFMQSERVDSGRAGDDSFGSLFIHASCVPREARHGIVLESAIIYLLSIRSR